MVLAGGVQDRLVLFRRGFPQQPPELQDAPRCRICGFVKQVLDGRLVEALDLHARRRQPVLELRHAVWVVQTGEPLQLLHMRLSGCVVDVDRRLRQVNIGQHSSLVCPCVEGLHFSLPFRDRKVQQALVYRSLGFRVPAAVFYKILPLLRGVLRQIPRPASVGDCRLARLAKIGD